MKKPFDPQTMGFGKHKYSYIDPEKFDLNFEPPGGLRTRDFVAALNTKNPETDLTVDHISRPGTSFETNAEGYEGAWLITAIPLLTNGVLYAVACRLSEDNVVQAEPAKLISAVDLGVVADRVTAYYKNNVRTVLRDGGSAGKAVRERLTRLTYKPRILSEEEIDSQK